MNDFMPKKNYDLTEITGLLLGMRENCAPKADDVYEDPKRAEKYDALNAAIDLINNPSMIERWISVKDRLPDVGKRVLLFTRYGYVAIGERSRANHGVFSMVGVPAMKIGEITHWMPLPEPPKEE